MALFLVHLCLLLKLLLKFLRRLPWYYLRFYGRKSCYWISDDNNSDTGTTISGKVSGTSISFDDAFIVAGK